METSGHKPEAVAAFLMRALFTMFAEDMELLPKDSFLNLLQSLAGHPEHFVPMIEELWNRMKTGGFSTVLREKVLRFNGGLFEVARALPLNADQFGLLIEASRADWRDVEPAIFGTLLERALSPIERHKLGAHYTPRAYVERLVLPTVVEPLRAEWDATEPLLDEKEGSPTKGQPLTRWDGRTMKKHPVTGEEVPDESARVPVLRYKNPRKATWPQAEFVIGNPPFVGTARMRDALGDGYTEALRATHREVPESSDFVMYWWNHAANLTRQEKIRRFGFIATNSLRQTFNRRVIEPHLAAANPVSILFAIPDHPWADSAVRISMTVATAGQDEGVLKEVIGEVPAPDGRMCVEFREKQTFMPI